MKDIDEELSAQINKVFENFDDGLSEQGWAALREKYPEKSSKKLPLWWISGIAASLLIVAGLWLFLNQPLQNEVDQTQTIVKKTDDSTDQFKPTSPQLNAKQQDAILPDPSFEKNNQRLNERLIIEQPVAINREKVMAAIPEKNQKIDNGITAVPLQPLVLDTSTSKNVATINPVQKATTTVTNPIDNNQQQPTVKANVKPTKSTEDFLSEQSQLMTANEKKSPTVKRTPTKSSFEIFTGTFLNYAGDNDVKVNAGVGLNANIKVSNSIFLAVGAGVSQNKMGYGNQSNVPQTASNALPMSDAGVAYTSAPFVTDVKLSAQLLAIDLPIVVKFYPTKKQNFYVSTGINSNSYLNQQYTYSYRIVSPSSLYKVPEMEEQVEKSDLKGFDFANSAIFAIGINQRIGTNQLIFEPYFKPAIGNMGDKNLRINTIGINLRFNFSDSVKK